MRAIVQEVPFFLPLTRGRRSLSSATSGAKSCLRGTSSPPRGTEGGRYARDDRNGRVPGAGDDRPSVGAVVRPVRQQHAPAAAVSDFFEREPEQPHCLA